jgi:hypothetical protein
MPALEPASTAYISDSRPPKGLNHAIASRVGIVINVGDALLTVARQPINSLQRGYHRTMRLIVAATAALGESVAATFPAGEPEVGDTVLWTFDRPKFPPRRRLRVRVGGSGFVHAGILGPGGVWNPVYNVPLMPLLDGGYEAVLPSGVNVFTFFWTEAPWAPGRPGHWERDRNAPRVFTALDE